MRLAATSCSGKIASPLATGTGPSCPLRQLAHCGKLAPRRPLPACHTWLTVYAVAVPAAGLLLFLAPMKAVLRARSERVLGVSEGEGAGWPVQAALGGPAACRCAAEGPHSRAPMPAPALTPALPTLPMLNPCAQDLNPLPFPAIVANCAGWVAYGYVTQDVLVLWPNVAGFLIGMFYTLSAYGLADTKTRDRQMAIMLFFSTVMMVVGAVGTLGDFEYGKLKNLWGFTANGALRRWPPWCGVPCRGQASKHLQALLPRLSQPGTSSRPLSCLACPPPPCFLPGNAARPLPAAILLIFYASPLSTLLEVLRTRCSASLNLPLSVMNVINGSLWLVSGLAISDYFIAVPNGVGAALGVLYCALILTFPRKSAK